MGASVAPAFSPDGGTLVSASDSTVCFWDPATGEPRAGRRGPEVAYVAPLAFSPDGSTMAAGGDSGTVLFWRADSGSSSGTRNPATPTR